MITLPKLKEAPFMFEMFRYAQRAVENQFQEEGIKE